jgi:hypothetical protein
MKDFKQISNDAFYNMEDYHQITIDLIERTDELFNEIDEVDSDKDRNEKIEYLGALSYDIDTTLEVFNPNFEIEISDLKDVLIHIKSKIEELKLFT